MKFSRRLKLFGFGLLLGLLLVVVLFNDKSNLITNWLPNARVIDRLQATTNDFSAIAQCQLECYKIEKDSLNVLLENGDVRFDESLTQENPIIYLVQVENFDNRLFNMYFSAGDSTATVTAIKPADESDLCDCE